MDSKVTPEQQNNFLPAQFITKTVDELYVLALLLLANKRKNFQILEMSGKLIKLRTTSHEDQMIKF